MYPYKKFDQYGCTVVGGLVNCTYKIQHCTGSVEHRVTRVLALSAF
jgi:hypothetical protein